ncbi:MAG: NUDIX domain-containing protein [Candidatus Latescibacteria bacterium]|nr:NUDIX domain-containing protein [Candidatus Latescibacterota bacterium]
MSFYASLPAKRMSANALFFDQAGHLLLVKPTYRDHWHLPGGIVEKDESPQAACRREVCEELGLDLPIGRLLVVDYTAGQGDWTEKLEFVFYGGRLNQTQIDGIKLPAEELAEYRFVAGAQSIGMLSPMTGRIAAQALGAVNEGATRYLENQLPVS